MIRTAGLINTLSVFHRSFNRSMCSILTTHPAFSNPTASQATCHLGLFVGQASKWREDGLPWRMYIPHDRWSQRLGKEIGPMEAIERLSKKLPVKFQPMRTLSIVPDFQALEAIVTTLAIPGTKGLAGASKKAGSLQKSTKVQPAPGSIELKYGQATTLTSYSELMLFSAIYNEEVSLPSKSKETTNDEETLLNSQIQIANYIGNLYKRGLTSGIDFYSVEESFSRKFGYHFPRQAALWIPTCILFFPFIASASAMSYIGMEPLGLAELGLAELVQTVKNKDDMLTDVEYGLVLGGVVSMLLTTFRSLYLSFSPLGFPLTAYKAFKCLCDGVPICLQEVQMKTVRVPFLTTIVYFTKYRPGDLIENSYQLEKFYHMQTNSEKILIGKEE